METTELIPVSFFVVESGPAVGREIIITDALESQPVFIIGSDARANLRLDDAEAAPAHAIIQRHGNAYQIEPRFGGLTLWVNSQPVKSMKRLEAGDQVQIGSTTLRYVEDRRRLPVKIVPASAQALATIAPVFSQPKPSYGLQPALASATAVMPVSNVGEIYFPPSGRSAGEVSMSGIALGLATVLIVVIALAFSLTGSLGGGVETAALSRFAFNDGNATVVMFTASWCQYCKQQKPILEGVAQEYKGDVYVQYVDIDDRANAALVSQYGAYSIPLTVVMNDQGATSSQFLGVQQGNTLRQAFDLALDQSTGSPATARR